MAEALLSIRGLGCERDGRVLFRALDLVVEAGQCVALTGPNGSGKSTLLRCISGLFPDFEGQIEAAALTYLGHRPGVSLSLSPLENLRWYAALGAAAEPDDAEALVALLEQVGLAGYEALLCQGLSAGQQRRVALARLMMDASRLWLLDEPFTALDADGQHLVRTLIRRHTAEGGAVLCATHQDLEIPGSRILDLSAQGDAA